MQLSLWCHEFRKNGISAFVNALTLGIVYVSTEDARAFANSGFSRDCAGVHNICQLLTSQGLLVESRSDDNKTLDELREKMKSQISLELLYMLVTDGCNLKCSYCFEETPLCDVRFKAARMDKKTIIASLNLFAEKTARYGNPEKRKVIHIYGGEPMINRRAVYDAVSYASELKKQKILPDSCRVAIVTNGVLLREEDAKFFSKFDVTVGLSVDGPAQITDTYRNAKRRGISVSEHVAAAFRMLKRHGVSVGLSVTLTPLAVERVDEFLEFFIDGEFRAADGVSLNMLHFTPNMDLSEEYYRAAVECQIEAFKRFREIGIYEERIMRKARAFVKQEPVYSDCGVVGHQLVIAPDGRIGVCQDFVKPRKYFPCSVHDDDHSNLLEVLFAGWRYRSPLFMQQCLGCPALGICGGGCLASAELKTGSRQNLDDRACYHSKRILEWLIWDAYDRIAR